MVLVRNIFDSVMSLLDFYNKGAFQTSYFRCRLAGLDEETKIDLLIENVIPWYFQFVASWDLAEKQKRLEVHWLTYEEPDRRQTFEPFSRCSSSTASGHRVEVSSKESGEIESEEVERTASIKE